MACCNYLHQGSTLRVDLSMEMALNANSMWFTAVCRGHAADHQQPEVNYLPRFSPQLISLERYTLSVYRAGEIGLFENLDIVHIRLLVGTAQ